MSRRPANVVQADISRALRAAQQAGLAWRVEIEGKVIRLVQGPSPADLPPEPPTPENSLAPEERWHL
jgi:hypothetical protein